VGDHRGEEAVRTVDAEGLLVAFLVVSFVAAGVLQGRSSGTNRQPA